MDNTTTQMDHLVIDDDCNDSIIKTIRLDNVIQLVEDFFKYNNLKNDYINVIVTSIYRETASNIRVPPKQLLFDKNKICEFLDSLKEKVDAGTIDSFFAELIQSMQQN